VAGFSSNDECDDVLSAELFGIYNGLVLLINLLMERQSHFFHVYASLLAQITSLLDHHSGFLFKHVLREGNVCAYFLAKLGRNSTLRVTT